MDANSSISWYGAKTYACSVALLTRVLNFSFSINHIHDTTTSQPWFSVLVLKQIVLKQIILEHLSTNLEAFWIINFFFFIFSIALFMPN